MKIWTMNQDGNNEKIKKSVKPMKRNLGAKEKAVTDAFMIRAERDREKGRGLGKIKDRKREIPENEDHRSREEGPGREKAEKKRERESERGVERR